MVLRRDELRECSATENKSNRTRGARPSETQAFVLECGLGLRLAAQAGWKMEDGKRREEMRGYRSKCRHYRQYC